MLPIANAIEEIAGFDPQSLSDELLTRTQPAVFRGLVSSWPVVARGPRIGRGDRCVSATLLQGRDRQRDARRA